MSRQECRAAGESLAPLNRPGSGLGGKRWWSLMAVQRGLYRWPLHGLLKRSYATGRLDVPTNNHHQRASSSKVKFPLRTCRVSHKTWWPSFVPTSDASRKSCSSLSGWLETIERPLVRDLTSPFTYPNRSKCAPTYSCFTIKSLTLLFGQTMLENLRDTTPSRRFSKKRKVNCMGLE